MEAVPDGVLNSARSLVVCHPEEIGEVKDSPGEDSGDDEGTCSVFFEKVSCGKYEIDKKVKIQRAYTTTTLRYPQFPFAFGRKANHERYFLRFVNGRRYRNTINSRSSNRAARRDIKLFWHKQTALGNFSLHIYGN